MTSEDLRYFETGFRERETGVDDCEVVSALYTAVQILILRCLPSYSGLMLGYTPLACDSLSPAVKMGIAMLVAYEVS